MNTNEHESDRELPHHITHFLLEKTTERYIRIMEREALNELFEQLEPGQYFGIQNINSFI